MILANQYFLNNLKDLGLHGVWDQGGRARWSDGKPARAIGIQQVFEKYDISRGEFPINTLRPTALRKGLGELFWIYRDQSNSLSRLAELGVDWWDNWDVGDGTIGHRYGYTVRKSGQINDLLHNLVTDPTSRRHIVSLWDPSDFKDSPGLLPCAFQFMVHVQGLRVNLTLIQRSNDYIMAGAINKAQYVCLQMMLVSHLRYHTGQDYVAGTFAHLTGDLHVYDRHLFAVDEILARSSDDMFQPEIKYVSEPKDFFDIDFSDFEFVTTSIPKLSKSLEIAI